MDRALQMAYKLSHVVFKATYCNLACRLLTTILTQDNRDEEGACPDQGCACPDQGRWCNIFGVSAETGGGPCAVHLLLKDTRHPAARHSQSRLLFCA